MNTTLRFTACCLVLLSAFLPVPCAVSAANAMEPALSQQLQGIVLGLGSADFAIRTAASEKLKTLAADEIAELATVARDQPNAEVVVRIQAEIESRYKSDNPEDVQIASRALETFAINSRLVLADQAAQALRLHWQTRVDLAVTDLEKFGATIRKGDFTGGQFNRLFPRQVRSVASLQVFITETWKGGDEGLAVFERLAALCNTGPLNPGGLSVFVIGGSDLTDEQEIRLNGIVGNNRVVKRSRVALGIRGTPTTDQGVLISEVSDGSSAKAAGLESGDLILAIEDPNAPAETDNDTDGKDISDPENRDPDKDKTLLRDFDDLVERLWDYKPGDVMTIRIIRDYPRFRSVQMFGGPQRGRFPHEPLKIEVVKVKLKSWLDLKVKE